MVISVKLKEAQFEGQTKAKLGNTEIRTLVDGLVSEKLQTYLEENPAVAKAISKKLLRLREQGMQHEKLEILCEENPR